MTYPELLRTLIRFAPMPEPVQKDAYALIDELERMNVFGSLGTKMEVQEHTCYGGLNTFVTGGRCIYCGKEPPL